MTLDAAAYGAPASDQFEIGRVLSGTLETIRRQFPLLVLLAALCVFLPAVMTGLVNFKLNSSPRMHAFHFFWDELIHWRDLPDDPNGYGLFLSLAGLVGGLFLQAAAASVTVADFEGAEIPNPASAWRHLLPLLGIDIIIGAAVIVGALSLVLPGILAMLAFSVAGPVRVEEGRGVFGSLQRSRELTRGDRWPVLLLLLLYGLADVAFRTVLDSVKLVLHAPVAIWAVSIGPLLTTALAMVRTVGLTVIYCELRVAKDGPTSPATAFD